MSAEGNAGRSTLLFIVGPPAVGKMTVGTLVAERTGLRLFHNHLSIELVLPIFPFESPEFARLVREFRRRIFAEVAASTLPGLIFTYVWAFDDPQEQVQLDGFAAPFRERGARILYAELQATQEERLRRNRAPERLTAKPSKRDIDRSAAHLVDADARYELDSGDRFAGRGDYLRLETTDRSAESVAEEIISSFGLSSLR